MFLLGFILYGTLCASWTWLTISFSMLEKFSNYNLSKIFSCPFFSSSSSGTPIIQMLVHLILCQRSLRLSSVPFILFTYSALHKLFPPFYIPAHWFILLLQIFCYWFLLEHSCLENLMGRGAWWAAVHGVTKSDTSEWLHFHFSLAFIGEGNGNPLQCSCLENLRDGGAWWAAVYGVARSQTRLKRLSSSSSSSHTLYVPRIKCK